MMNNLPEPSSAEVRPIGRLSPDIISAQVYPAGSGKLIASGGVGVGEGVAVLVAEGWMVIVGVGGRAVLVGVEVGVEGPVQAPKITRNSRARNTISTGFFFVPGMRNLQLDA
jgi:hypothetical protein